MQVTWYRRTQLRASLPRQAYRPIRTAATNGCEILTFLRGKEFTNRDITNFVCKCVSFNYNLNASYFLCIVLVVLVCLLCVGANSLPIGIPYPFASVADRILISSQSTTATSQMVRNHFLKCNFRAANSKINCSVWTWIR